ncbi:MULTISPECIES: LeuA family protein [unclassified Haloferax]|uniref:LeuA family protein n=1 Tax=unclassified Haloferax TaxID=2625095 RepID=UPI000E268C86|nr:MULTISPECIES: LeuA family protein [unclassified Haloferax]RDZ33544.1 homocitrate synthase [Haloferax sp. Atlit-24N]RLM34330.1 homocitrate synthase [Haloferax sp. Atlit-109R]RLM41148.1 homocitrate synthase [Haloferax sp. Atlit-105R]
MAATVPVLLDVTCREGEQRPGASYTTGQKAAAVRALDDLGVDYVQVGFPIAGAQTGEVCDAVDVETKLTGIARAVPKDVEAAVDAGVDVIDVFAPTSERQRTELLGKDADELRSLVGETVDSATETGLEVHFTAMDGFRTDPAFLDNLFDSIDATYLTIADTVGSKTPFEVSSFLHDLDTDPTRLGVHFHDDLGVATANALTAVAHDVQKVDVSVAGIGERAGNVPVEEFVVAAETSRAVNRPALDPSTLIPRANDVLTALDESVPAEKSVLGADVFSHESGLHTAAMLDDPATFEPFDPAVFGGSRTLYFGPQSGTGAARRLLERAGDDDPDESRVAALVETLRSLDEPVPTDEALDIARGL